MHTTRKKNVPVRFILTVAALAAVTALSALPAAADTSQFASGWSVNHDPDWTPAPPDTNVLGPLDSLCTGTSTPTGSWAEFTFPAFGIPGGDTITGIEVTIWYEAGGDTPNPAQLKLGGVDVGSPQGLPTTPTPLSCSESAERSAGGPGDLWGTTLDDADFNSGTISVRVTQASPTFGPDAIRLTAFHGNEPPVADAGPDDTVECASPGGTSVMLDGSGSTDPDGDSLTFTWTGPFAEGGGTSTGETPTVTLPLGVHVISLEVDDGNGETDTDTVQVTVADTTEPVVTLNGLSEVTLECSIDGYVEQDATASDACEGVLPVSTSGSIDESTIGTYIITYTATDSSANEGSATRTVNVVDTTPPDITLNGPSEVTLECGVDTYVEQGATAVDACEGSVAVQISGSVDVGTPGTYEITYTATDSSSNEATETRTVHVVDTIAPEIELAPGPIALWPPNHKYDTISLDDIVVSATDICDENVSAADVAVTSVSSDEPEDAKGGGDGKTTEDILIAGDCRSVDLRAERQGSGNGRVYTIDMAVSDASGNTGTASFEVHVPHQANGAAVDDGPDYSVAGCPVAISPITASSTVFKGKIVDVEDGAGLAGVEVLGPGEAVARTDERGRYTLTVPGDLDTYQIRLKQDGYVTRRTYVDASKRVNRANLSMIPLGKGVDMVFFDQVVRDSGAEGAPRSRRWVEEPVFEISSRQFDSVVGRSALSAGDRLPKQFRQMLEDWLRQDVPLYSGGVLTGDQIRWVRPARGDDLEAGQPGAIQVMVNAGTCTSGASAVATVNWREPGILEGGRIGLLANCGGLNRRAFSHQLAHQLGFFHPNGGAETALPSIMGDAESDGPTAADILHARVLYQRFPGNRAPDKDPHPKKLRSLGEESAGRSMTKVHRN